VVDPSRTPDVRSLLAQVAKVVIVKQVRCASEEPVRNTLLADFAVRKQLPTDQRRGVWFSVTAAVRDFVNSRFGYSLACAIETGTSRPVHGAVTRGRCSRAAQPRAAEFRFGHCMMISIIHENPRLPLIYFDHVPTEIMHVASQAKG
jgi:hypothetical protein